ncbi:hypothetical protein M501DRAFT_934552 [Patellaria atrata CBS 101060]|uniref:Translation machinery-associated protein 16 n=1 Tax=Patellaria atrata CBS 101060 TaxID=1346257 RepID=A0A9P4VQR5_9PEZI|nr:hypothetical protein M501DRAFT_934552 [Patellaria atrata CBS 101060]
MPSNLNKVQKHINKKKGRSTPLHANSRDSRRLQRASQRDEKIAKLASAREKANRPHLQRISFLQDEALNHPEAFTSDEIKDIIQQYLKRNDAEIEALKAERRLGRPASNRQTLLEQQRALEQKEYVSGLWLPDLEDENNLNLLRNWNGEWVHLSTMKYIRLSDRGVKHESSFPPKGLS